jgi:iron complex outermembrane receptor protein
MVAAILAASSAAAQTTGTTLEEVVVTGQFISETGRSALKLDVPLRDVPLTISSYTDSFMKAIETTRISDLYNYMTGVQRAGNTAYDVAIRGFASGGADRNTIMMDGLPGMAVRFGSPPTISAERVEVVKGPASILYGQVQPGGFINIVSKKPQSVASNMVRLRGDGYSGSGAKFGDTTGFTASFDSTGPIDDNARFLYRLIGEYGDDPGFRDFGKSDTRYIVPSLTVNFTENTSATAFVEYRKETVSWDDGLVAPNNAAGVPDWRLVNKKLTTYYHEPGDTNKEEGTVLGLSFTHEFSPSVRWNVQLRDVDHKDQRQALDFQGTRVCSPQSVAGQLDPTDLCVRRRQRDQLNKRTYKFGDTNLVVDVGSGSITHKVLLGINAGKETADFRRLDFGTNNNTYDISVAHPVYGQGTPNAPTPNSWSLTTYDSFAAYLQDQISLGERWKLLAGVRYESFDIVASSKLPVGAPFWSADQTTKGNTTKPMVGIMYQPNDQWSYYVSYATSFNPPAPGRLDINGNIFKDPEEGEQYEVGAKADLLDNRVTGTLAVFRIAKKNSLQQIGTTGVFQLTGEEESKGAEFEIDASVTDRWQVLAGYSYVDATVKSDVDTAIIGQQLRNVPKTKVSMWNRYQLNPALSFGLGVNYVSERYGTVPDDAGNSARLVLPAYTLVDAALYYTNERYDFDVTVKLGNVLNEWYLESAFTPIRIAPGIPRNLTLSLTKRF